MGSKLTHVVSRISVHEITVLVDGWMHGWMCWHWMMMMMMGKIWEWFGILNKSIRDPKRSFLLLPLGGQFSIPGLNSFLLHSHWSVHLNDITTNRTIISNQSFQNPSSDKTKGNSLGNSLSNSLGNSLDNSLSNSLDFISSRHVTRGGKEKGRQREKERVKQFKSH